MTTAVPAVSGNAGDPSAAIATLLSAYMAANPELYQSNSAAIASISEYLAQGGYAAAAAQGELTDRLASKHNKRLTFVSQFLLPPAQPLVSLAQ